MKRPFALGLMLALLLLPSLSLPGLANPDFTCADVSEIPPLECDGLVTLYNNTNGTGWVNDTNWLVTNTPHDWYGVTVEDGHVTQLILPANQLAGSFPGGLGYLSNLQTLDLSDNQLSGEIPGWLWVLSSLEIVRLNNNLFSHTVAPEFGLLKNLVELRLDHNQLTGDIPEELGNLVNLKRLQLNNNQFVAYIPPELGALPVLEYLHLDNNQLSSIIPPELGNLTNLKWLRLNRNYLSGDIPATFVSLVNLTVPGEDSGDEYGLDLNDNFLSVPPDYPNPDIPLHVFLSQKDPDWYVSQYSSWCGPVTEIPLSECEALWALFNHNNGPAWTNSSNWLQNYIPSTWYGVTVASGHVTGISLPDNNLAGQIRAELESLTHLQHLDIASNQLNWYIPPELGNLTALEYLSIRDNQIIGSVPLSFINLANLESFYFDLNELCEPTTTEYLAWKAVIPDYIGTGINCEFLTCDDVEEIPLAECEALVTFYNETNGPGWLDDTNWMKTKTPSDWYGVAVVSGHVGGLNLKNNQLSGSLPTILGVLSSLTSLDMSDNQLTGFIPTEIGSMSGLETLYLQHNQLTGSLPSELGSLRELAFVDLSGNQIGGALPAWFGGLSELVILHLGDNQLSSSIPPELGNLGKIWLLNLEDNLLSGAIPSSIGNLTSLYILQLDGNELSGDVPDSLANLVHLYYPWEPYLVMTGLALDYNLLNVPVDYPNPENPLHTLLQQKNPTWNLNQGIVEVVDAAGAELTAPDGSATIIIPAGTLSEPVTFTYAPQPAPDYDQGELTFMEISFELTAEDEEGIPLTVFDPPLVITLSYTDQDLGSSPEDSLALYYWDASASAWVDAATTCPAEYTRDLAGNTLSLPICHFSEFAVLGDPPLRTFLPVVQVRR